jgi:hypothetical protein
MREVARQKIAAPDGPETHLSRKRVPVAQSTILSSGPIDGADTLTIQLIQSDRMPAVVRIVWPTTATITTPAHYLEVASAAMRLLAEASTTLARIRESRRLEPTWTYQHGTAPDPEIRATQIIDADDLLDCFDDPKVLGH